MATNQPTTRAHNVKDLVGQRFGKLLVVAYAGTSKHKKSLWQCRCDCGNFKTVAACHLKVVQSCGCYRVEFGERFVKHGYSGGRRKRRPEYTAWAGMIDRCTRPGSRSYPDYGGRGITVCERWRVSFETFLADMGNRPTPRHSLDRFPDGNGNYEPGNCRWATPKEQNNNRRCSINLTHDGRTQTLLEWALELGMKESTLYQRLFRSKMVVSEALTLGVRPYGHLDPEQIVQRLRARQAVQTAYRYGRMPWPRTLACHYCDKPADGYHHHLGYEPEHWLSVVPACTACNNRRDTVS